MKEDIRLFICDIDGTLVEKGGKPGKKTHEMIKRIHDAGIPFGLASGRPVDQRTIGKLKDWGFDFEPDVLIGVNGVETWNRYDRKKKRIKLLPKEEVKRILDYMWPLDVNVCVFEDGYNKVIARRRDWMIEESMNRNKSNVEFVDKERFYKYDVVKLEFHYDEDRYEDQIMELIKAHPSKESVWIKSFKGTLEFMRPGIDKGVALVNICDQLHIPLEKVVACGDMDNDISMLEKAGTGICLANGSEETKKAADFVTEKGVAEDGLGEFVLKKYF